MSTAAKQSRTPEAYLEFERASEERHEYLDGEVFLLAGTSNNHNLIQANTLASLHAQLRQHPCFVYPSDMRLKVSRTGLYTYPDISIVCGTPKIEDEHLDTLLNPTLIVEVLSSSTERYDRGKKFQHYRALESLQEYVLISQDTYQIERYLRQSDGQWLFSDASGEDPTLELRSVPCTLLLVDVYEKVVFEDE
jgi:Uma2 family endonuclease